MHKLIIEDDEGRTTVVPLVRDELTIGRKEGNTIRLTERNVSRAHARLSRKNGAFLVEDLGSYTGVRVNGLRIEAPTQVRDGDLVTIGDYKLSVRAEAGEGDAPRTADHLPAAPVESAARPGTAAAISTAAAATVPALDAEGIPSANDAAPTIPVRTLAERGLLADQPRTAPARLVVVTSSLAGSEFRIDRASMVIGRTEENDIIVNHPSISRHHAKIVRDGDRYTVVDLQSANGVRVGGESYERVDLQPGDVVELGHVKLRLVGPDETWAYDPKEFASGPRRRLKIGAAAGGVALAIGVIVFLQIRKDSSVDDEEAAEENRPDGKAVAAAGTPPGAPAPPASAREPAPEQMLAQASTAIDEERWDQALTTLDLLLNRVEGDPTAASVTARAGILKKKVELERHSAEAYAAFDEAAKAKEPDVALTRFDSIPTASLYKSRAEPALAEIKTQFLAVHLELAEAARTQGRCDDVRGEVEKIDQVDPENRRARAIVKSCRPLPAARPVAAASTTAAPVTVRPVARAARTSRTGAGREAMATNSVDDPAGSAEASSNDPADLIRQARAAWLHQQCGQAIDLSRRALRAKANAGEAHQIIAVCACSMRDKDGALKSYARLDERNRSMVRTICLKNGVDLEP